MQSLSERDNHVVGRQDSTKPEGLEKRVMLEVTDNKFNDAQKAYIRKYAAGLLLAWAGPAVIDHISPDTMDGFNPPEGVFPEYDDNNPDEDYVYYGANAVGTLLDNWLDEIAKIAGFTEDHLREVYSQMNRSMVYAKYPIMKEETDG